MADGSKTEKATPKKRSDERKKGNVFLSQDAIAVATLFASVFLLNILGRFIVEQITLFTYYCMDRATRPLDDLEGGLSEIVAEGIMVLAKTAGPLMAVTIAVAVAATFAQTRFLVAGESLKPKFSRLSPLQGIKRLFSLKSIVEALKGILKISVLLVIIYQNLSAVAATIANYMYAEVEGVCAALFSQIITMSLQIALAFLVLAGFDFFYQWWDYERQLKMSKQEIKEEFKQMEGDPQIKGKIKETQRKMAQSRMMQQVPQADVVVRNPTHFAVALRYKPERDNAPVVLAKGMDELALRIVKVAEESGVAVVENVPLARSLYATAELEREIPPELYGAVAEVLVFLFKVDAEKGGH